MTIGKLAAAATAAAAIALGGPAHAATAPAAPAGLKVMSATFAVTDVDRAVDFYVKGLGLTVARRIENPTNSEVPLLFPGGGLSLLLIRSKTPSAAAPGQPPRIGRVILDVADVRALEARLTAAGYPLRHPVVENPTHHVLVGLATDPDGNELELVQRPR
ncbi:VOC family protein [Phenylobacterium sp. LjRoot219]|uniref:VOC family protein n=1 Tax=Phenylobacterium sp. LjRoot219 TaxID=3342283 RepID=UPI003ED0D759